MANGMKMTDICLGRAPEEENKGKIGRKDVLHDK